MKYAVITDIHANYEALKAIDLDKRTLQNDLNLNDEIQYWFLGDLMGYGPDPLECIDWFLNSSRLKERFVFGNHDEWLISPEKVHEHAKITLSDHLDALTDPPPNQFEDRAQFLQVLEQVIKTENRSFVEETWPDMRLVFTHGSIRKKIERSHYVKPWKVSNVSAEISQLQKLRGDETYTIMFCGHNHYPMWATERGFLPLKYNRFLPLSKGISILNPGSVGQPRDGDSRAAYLIVDVEAKSVMFRRVAYDVQAVVERMKDRTYPIELRERLIHADGQADLIEYSEFYRKPIWDLDFVHADYFDVEHLKNLTEALSG